MKSIFFSIIALFISLYSFSQPQAKKIDKLPHQLYFGKLSNNDFFYESDYVFEAEIVSHKTIVNNDTTKVWTSTVFEVTQIFKGKGEIRKGSIEFIRDCGALYHDMNSLTPGILIFDYNTEFCLSTAKKMVLFCKKATISYQKTDNDFAVQPLENAEYAALYFTDMREHNFKVYGLKDLYFKTIEDFYNYAEKKKGITVPSSGDDKKKASLKSGSANEYKNERLDSFMRWQYQLLDYAKQNRKEQAKLKSSSATNNLSITIQNQKVTGTSSMYFEFDVFVSANNSNTYYSNAIARIDFNTAVFGYNLEASGNITLTRGSSFSSSTYETKVYDVSSSRVNISLNEKSGLTSWNRTKLTTTAVQLYHVKIEILPTAVNGNANITFQEIDFTSMFSSYSLSATGNYTTEMSYDNTTYTNSPAFAINLGPVIQSFSPWNVKAGAGESLYIYGSNFGTTQGKVSFKNADRGGSQYIDGISGYIQSWSNTQIEVIVPSNVHDNFTNTWASAGSGDFQVITSTGKAATSPYDLTVDYSLLNFAIPLPTNDGRQYLVKNGSTNGMVFTLHSNVASNSSAVKCIEKALCAWSGYLGIEMKLEKNASGGYVTVSSPNQTGRNVIWKNTSRKYGMGTDRFASACPVSGKSYYYRKDKTDIEFGNYAVNTASWDYRTSGTVSSGYGSFYNAFLHELGHALGLDHVVDPNALMYYSIDINNSQPIIELPSTGGMPLTAVNRIYTDSRNINWGCSGIAKISKVPPTVTYYAINNGASKTRNILRNVDLNNRCTVCPTHYIASQSSTFSGTGWQEYETAPKFKLSRGRGTKTVYFKVRNAAGESARMVDQIYYRPYISFGSSTKSATIKSAEITNEISENSTITEINYEFSEESLSVDYDIMAYPVPCVDNINIVVPSQIQGDYKVTVVDINGATVLTDNINSERKSIDLSGLQKGTYIIRLFSNKNVYVKTIVKQ